ncbi:hypothetical protein RFI_06017 [Reticulomyxa filosa]|uniref:Tetrapyrrole biosynthesis uroporphyrinogen III synthase domain-containing protein n=1 Tax=Reticulomyxa filosa TaxID=46433 RepID=X6P0P2_RETFI|nr:hypothetical protein RFI_06017 [Reticulomyxa filosa]|eukprot:ETO31102.1 hypothetical protein RFI_06017 [Reticulomyxa filosa]
MCGKSSDNESDSKQSITTGLNFTNEKDFSLPFPIFALGEATKQTLSEKFPALNVMTFEESVDGRSLAAAIVKYDKSRNKEEKTKPLLLLLGERHRPELMTELSSEHISFDTEIVYKSVDNEELGNFTTAKGDTENSPLVVVWCFFSPNGVTVVDKHVSSKFSQNLSEFVTQNNIVTCAFGNTTARRISDFKCNVDIVSQKPTAEALASVIKEYAQHKQQ